MQHDCVYAWRNGIKTQNEHVTCNVEKEKAI